MTDFETLILNQTQDQMQHMWFQFRPFGKQRKYNELDKTTKYVVDNLREKGIKAGLVKVRMFRPFPAEELSKALSNAKVVAVLDKSDSLNGIGGALFEDVVSGMFTEKVNVPTVSYVYGIGGRDTTAEDIESVYNDLSKIDLSKKIEDPYRYLGVRKGDK